MRIILLVFICFLANSFCFASDNRSGATTVTFGAAYYQFSSKRDLKNASMPNIAVAYNFNERWAVEGDIGMINTNQRSNNQGVHGILYMFDGLYRLKSRGRFEPYVLAGVGMLGLKPNGKDPEHQGNVNAGVGTQYFVNSSIALRGEFRDLFTMSGGKNDWMLNLGVSFLLDELWKSNQ